MTGEPKTFTYFYKNDKAAGESIEDAVDLKTTKGHTYRDFKAKKFLFFEDIHSAVLWYNMQKKPQIHSVVNKYQQVRFSLELDMTVDLLDKIILTTAFVKQCEDAGVNVNFVKAMNCFKNITRSINNVLEEHYGIEASDYTKYKAIDHREDVKYSFRIYMKLAFENMHEYNHFISLLKKEVSPIVMPMIDATKSMLRVPGSWKDDHQCKWTCEDAFLDYATLTHTETCDTLPAIAPKEALVEYDDMPDGDVKKAVALISSHTAVIGNFYYTGFDKGYLKLKRIQPAVCSICRRKHDNIDAYAVIYRGHVYFRCYRADADGLGSAYIGYIGQLEKADIKFSTVKVMMRKIEKQNKELDIVKMSNKEKQQMADGASKQFEELKKEAEKNSIMNADKFYYTDFNKFHKKVFTDYTQFNRYVEQTISKIVMGGNCLYITSDYWKGTKHFTELANLPCSKPTEAYEFSIINPEFDKSQPVDKKNAMTITRRFGDVINEYTMMHFFKAVDFIPYLIPPEKKDTGIFNMFEGFRFAYQEQIIPVDSVKPWIGHILSVVCGGNAEQAKILIQWMAHIIQKPAEKAFAVILYGGQGTGKSILYEFFTRCIGKDYGLQVSKLDDLTQSHNTHLRGKLILNANEATNQPTHRDVNILKSLITETDLTINPKNVNQYTVSNYSRLLITSNYKHCMNLDKDDRRYFCLEASDNKKNNDAYFEPLVASLKNDQTQQDFFNYLANYDISDFKCQRPPMSKMKRELIEASVSNIVSFIKDICENNVSGIPYAEDENEIFISVKHLYNEYDAWVRTNDAKGRKSSRESLKEPLDTHLKIKQCRGPRPARAEGFTINRVIVLPEFKAAFANPEFNYVVSA